MTKHLRNYHVRNYRTQSGWTIWSMLFVMAVILFFSYVGMKLVPIYTENQNVKNAMEQSLEGEDLKKVSRTSIIRKMNAQLYLDGSHKLLDYKSELKVKRSRKEFFVETHYTREIPLFFNLSLIAKFDNVVTKNLASSE